MNEVWYGGMQWASWSMMLLVILFIVCPPIALIVLFPFPHKFHKIPMVRFFGIFASHLQFVAILYGIVVIPLTSNADRDNLFPTWLELAFLVWLGANLTAELTNPVGSSSLRTMKLIILAFSAIAVFLHAFAWLSGPDSYFGTRLMYMRNQVMSIPVFISVQMV